MPVAHRERICPGEQTSKKPRRKPTARRATAEDRRHATVCRLLASFRNPVVAALGLTEGQAIRHLLPPALYRSAALIVVGQRPELARGDPSELAKEACRLTEALLEVVDGDLPT